MILINSPQYYPGCTGQEWWDRFICLLTLLDDQMKGLELSANQRPVRGSVTNQRVTWGQVTARWVMTLPRCQLSEWLSPMWAICQSGTFIANKYPQSSLLMTQGWAPGVNYWKVPKAEFVQWEVTALHSSSNFAVWVFKGLRTWNWDFGLPIKYGIHFNVRP